FDAMIKAIQSAVAGGEFLLGSRFTMADVIFGGTLRYMVHFKLLDALPEFTAYIERLEQRPALQRAQAINTKATEEHGLG
ncbi:MAG TPA: glutathione S-transferase C-terminal domain-containing protein, partial [Polyangiaceae bacterium]|nr:glutathione S-transferase C-terminal domain-containing protein [Polyangiaceae bacterium]